MEHATKTALLAGASGLVGNELMHILLESPHYDSVKIIGRRPLDIKHPKLEQLVVDFDRLENFRESLGADDVFCCLGTTIKTAGSQQAFRKVDYEYPAKLAELAKGQGAQKFLAISALGADSTSKVFYSRTKGQLEDALKKTGFPALHIFQPSLLLGDRKEFRLGEKAAVLFSPVFSPLLVGRLQKYKPISARRVAVAMHQAAQDPSLGAFTYPSNRIFTLSRKHPLAQKNGTG
ncbi:MAG TPA: oxidoreductase [Planococcus sp. (in: firmicutes)]|nr:oxidoreductase [Planococcus sp. (in: firmicutes)]